MGADDDTYTDDDRPPQSVVPLDIQAVVMVLGLGLVAGVVVVGCCLSRGRLEHLDPCGSRRNAKNHRRKRRGAGLGSPNPILLFPPRFFSMGQPSLMVWKVLTERRRDAKGAATFFLLPTTVLLAVWLLYACFSSKKSSGEIEQFLTVLSLVFVTQSTCANVVHEKASKLRESLRQMGLRAAPYWWSIFVVDGLLFGTLLSVLVASVAAPLRLFHNAGSGYGDGDVYAWPTLFGLAWCYCAASTAVGVFLSTLCGSTSTASLSSFAVTIVAITTFVVLKMSAPKALEEGRIGFFLCPPLALTLAVAGMSSTFARYPMTLRIGAATVSRWLLVDALLYAALAAYLARVLPTEDFGRRDPWWFPAACLLEKRTKKCGGQQDPPPPPPLTSENATAPLMDEEAPPPPSGGGPTVSIRNLRKSFGKHVALDDVSLDLEENETVALLGHNGAGKSTLLNLLTGLVPADAGTAAVYGGRDRGVLGVCPQHDVLFERLTTREHVALCAAIKSGRVDPTNAEGDELLRTFGLAHREDHLGRELSGGMRRKLSTACALVGGSKFVILDEPTTGLDALARRELWDLLAKIKRGRTVLLTTHYMDEADALGDQIAILRHGKIACHAPPEDLKRDLGADAYKLTCDLHPAPGDDAMSGHSSDDDNIELTVCSSSKPLDDDDDDEEDELSRVVAARVPGAKLWHDGRIDPTRRVYALPADRPTEIGGLVAELERDAKEGGPRFGVAAVGIGPSDLEDAFVSLGGDSRSPQQEQQEQQEQEDHLEEEKEEPAYKVHHEDGGSLWASFSTRVRALCRKRLLTARRDLKTIPLLLIPVAAAVAALVLNAEDEFGKRGTSTANVATAVIVMLAFIPAAGLVAEHVVAERSSKLRDVLTVAGCDAKCYVFGTFVGDAALFSAVVLAVAVIAAATGSAVATYRKTTPYKFPRDLADAPDSMVEEVASQVLHSVWVDDRWENDDWIPDRVPQWILDLTDDAVKAAEAKLNVTDDDWRTYEYEEIERGIRKWAAPGLWLCLPLFGIELLFFSYAASHLFSGPREAVVLLPMAALGLLFVPLILVSLVNLTVGKDGIGIVRVSKSTFLGVLFWGLALCSPHGALVVALCHLTTSLDRRFADDAPPFEATCAIAAIEALLYATISYVLDRRAAGTKIPRIMLAPPWGSTDEDEDVTRERERVEASFSTAAKKKKDRGLIVAGLRKVYRATKTKSNVVAVDNLSFSVAPGEIFGLLGANGAGKSSAVSCVVRATYPSAGDALVCSRSILDDFEEAARHLGVVAQTDTIYDGLTCGEHCALFASIRGVRDAGLAATVDAALSELGLDTPLVRSKLAKHLSGGQKRKLCSAMAIIGDPRVVLLDEPSAGLDPLSRRALWTALRRATKNRAVVLTSHSMEESEALCTRVAILVAGRARAIGTSTRLKRKFVSEYRLSLRLSNDDSKNPALAADQLVALLPAATPRPSTKARTLDFTLRCDDVDVGLLFSTLRDAATDLPIHSYTLSQPTLEQVFLAVVRQARQEDEEEDDHDATSRRDDRASTTTPRRRRRPDAAAILEAKRCCGLDHKSHRFVSLAASLVALLTFLPLTGLLGESPSYDDDRRPYDDDDRRQTGCHHDPGHQPPCSTSAVTLSSFPFLLAVLVAAVACCGCCCFLKPPPRSTT
ncbi:hypothetical protein CTAYLR_008160 [Chrysophaeum taylorii]|uniref:ABC transporter domain-containing protein n=1 Tax=Chrysophaeum taylorii TaxID=2483200 RepID=A0AAD7UL43_9STRA|nr:hypothetical protein CTAYLR_008160 [Chrysophaeum taylorii]